MQKLPLANAAFPQRNHRSGAAVGCLLEILIAGKCKAMREQTVEVAEDGASDSTGAHHRNCKRKRRERGLQCRACDDPRSRTDEGDARTRRKYPRKQCRQCLAWSRNCKQAKECCRHTSPPPNVMTRSAHAMRAGRCDVRINVR